MRALHLSLGAFGREGAGGVVRYHLEQASWLVRLGRPVVVGPGFAGLPASEWTARAAGVRRPYVQSGKLHPRLRDLLNRTVSLLRHAPAGAIFQPSWHASSDLQLRHRGPLAVMIHDFIPELLAEGRILGHMHNPYILENRRRLIGRADLILVNSESTRRDLLARYPTVGDRVRVTLLGSGLPAAPRVTPGVVAPFLLWVGRRAAYKNFARTLEAFARLRADGLRLVCVGGGPFEEGELAQLARLGLDGRVELRSAGDAELAGLYRDASGLVYTSQYEGFGLPVLEALGQGCPVLCASTSSLPEVGGAAALYCNPDDTEALREGLGLLLRQGRSEADCARRREQASPFTWERCFRTANAAYALLD